MEIMEIIVAAQAFFIALLAWRIVSLGDHVSAMMKDQMDINDNVIEMHLLNANRSEIVNERIDMAEEDIDTLKGKKSR